VFFHAVQMVHKPPAMKQANHRTCSSMTRWSILVALAMTSAGVGNTWLPMRELPPVAPFTKLFR